MSDNKTCADCGMPLAHPAEYHPFAMCKMFALTGSSTSAIDNIRAVVEYGMKAESKGVSLDAAMRDIKNVLGNS